MLEGALWEAGFGEGEREAARFRLSDDFGRWCADSAGWNGWKPPCTGVWVLMEPSNWATVGGRRIIENGLILGLAFSSSPLSSSASFSLSRSPSSSSSSRISVGDLRRHFRVLFFAWLLMSLGVPLLAPRICDLRFVGFFGSKSRENTRKSSVVRCRDRGDNRSSLVNSGGHEYELGVSSGSGLLSRL